MEEAYRKKSGRSSRKKLLTVKLSRKLNLKSEQSAHELKNNTY